MAAIRRVGRARLGLPLRRAPVPGLSGPALNGLVVRVAEPDDAAAVTALVRSAYRGEESRAGWTTEADLVADQRIDVAGVRTKITDPDGVVLLAGTPDDPLVACCELVDRTATRAGLAYFGMFAVRPTLQAAGLGRALLTEAEAYVVRRWGATALEMTVIAQRAELIGWYRRRGYTLTGETRPFPYGELVGGPALRDDLQFVVLHKPLPPTRP